MDKAGKMVVAKPASLPYGIYCLALIILINVVRMTSIFAMSQFYSYKNNGEEELPRFSIKKDTDLNFD